MTTASTTIAASPAPKRSRIRMRPIMLTILMVVAVLVIGGFTLERIAQASDARTYPAPGQMVTVNGIDLHFYVTGEATDQPTIILEGGNGGFSAQWVRVQEALSEDTRVVSYDRAGLGWSDTDSEPRDIFRNAEQLRAGLQALDIQPPYILVGHSLGGLFIRGYFEQYPDEVVGLVFVDASHPEQIERIEGLSVDSSMTMYNSMALLANFGVTRLYNPLATMVTTLPEQQRAESLAIGSTPKFFATTGNELVIWQNVADQLRNEDNLGDLPIIALTAGENVASDGGFGERGPLFRDLHLELAALSTVGEHRVVEGSDHFSIIMASEYAPEVVDAVRDVLLAATS
ncbi:MAG: alpha/beta hydrolase [Aggregatilineales bacterium]